MLKVSSRLRHKIVMVTPLPHLPVLILVWAVFLVGAAGAADTPPPPDTTTADQPIHILADTLLVDTDASMAEFSGNVRASQGKTVILSDRLKIFYKKGTVPDTGTPGNEQSVNKIVAAGNVKIEFDNRVAVAEQAVYTSIDRVLMLTGEQVKVTGDNNTIAGKKIIIHREDGRMIVESGPEKRVEAVLTPGKNGIN